MFLLFSYVYNTMISSYLYLFVYCKYRDMCVWVCYICKIHCTARVIVVKCASIIICHPKHGLKLGENITDIYRPCRLSQTLSLKSLMTCDSDAPAIVLFDPSVRALIKGRWQKYFIWRLWPVLKSPSTVSSYLVFMFTLSWLDWS